SSHVLHHYMLFFLSSLGHPPDLPSFPTRRSSDLGSITIAEALAQRPEDIEEERELDRELERKLEAATDPAETGQDAAEAVHDERDRKSTRLNSSHVKISYAVFCLKKKKAQTWSTS